MGLLRQGRPILSFYGVICLTRLLSNSIKGLFGITALMLNNGGF